VEKKADQLSRVAGLLRRQTAPNRFKVSGVDASVLLVHRVGTRLEDMNLRSGWLEVDARSALRPPRHGSSSTGVEQRSRKDARETETEAAEGYVFSSSVGTTWICPITAFPVVEGSSVDSATIPKNAQA
jgi:hypothetical protein